MDPRNRHHPSKNLVGFVVGDVHYAVPIDCVKEISNPMPIVALPHAPAAIAGVADYRGEVVPVVDLRLRFGLPSAPMTRRTKWIVVDLAGRLVALAVDEVTQVFGTGGADLRPSPSLGGGGMPGVAGVTSLEGGLVFVIDTAQLCDLTEPLAAAGNIGSGAQAPGLPQGTST